MKKMKITKNIVALLIAVVAFSCNVEEIKNETPSNSNIALRPGLLEVDCGKAPTREIVIQYNFSYTELPNGQVLTIDQLQQLQIKNAFRSDMNAFFTICSVIESDCDNVEKWVVDLTEYNDYWISGNGYGSGTSGVIIDDGLTDENSNNDAYNCF